MNQTETQIHFDFTLTQADAENLLYLFEHKISTNIQLMGEAICKKPADGEYVSQLKNDISYWKNLKTQLSNTTT